MTCIRCQHQGAKKFGTYGKRRVQRYRCISCRSTFTEPRPASFLGSMRTSEDAAIRAIQCLLEGCSIRSTERLTGLNRNTIMRLLIIAGQHSERLLDEQMRQLSYRRIQCDEIWTFLMKKARNVRTGDPAQFGDQWIFVALDADTKLVPTFLVGKRSS